MKLVQYKRIGVTLVVAAAVAACGGGGSDSTPAAGGGGSGSGGAAVAPPTDAVAAKGTLQVSAGASTYAGSSMHDDAFAVLNAVRSAAGAGYVFQSAAIDVAAAAHAKYLTTNRGAISDFHTEDAAKPDFYAVTTAGRMARAGYAARHVDEVIGGTGPSRKGSDCVLGLLNSVYHGVALLSQVTDVGIGFGVDGANVPMCVVDLGVPGGVIFPQVQASGELTGYPHAGQKSVFETFYVGYEVPRPSTTLFPGLTAGTPVIVNFANADFVNMQAAGTLSVTVTKFSLKDAGGNVVPAAVLANTTAATGAAKGAGVTLNSDAKLSAGVAVLVPLSPLAKAATYTAEFSVTLKSGGVPLTKTWSFTTNP